MFIAQYTIVPNQIERPISYTNLLKPITSFHKITNANIYSTIKLNCYKHL